MAVSLVPSQLNLTNSSGNSFSIVQDLNDPSVNFNSSGTVYCNPPLVVKSSSGLVCNSGDVVSHSGATSYSLNAVGASVSSSSSAITSLQSDVSKLQLQVSNLISVINTAFSLSLS